MGGEQGGDKGKPIPPAKWLTLDETASVMQQFAAQGLPSDGPAVVHEKDAKAAFSVIGLVLKELNIFPTEIGITPTPTGASSLTLVRLYARTAWEIIALLLAY